MIEKLAKKYLTPDKVADLSLRMAEEALIKFVDLIRNTEISANVGDNAYEVSVKDGKDRYEIVASGELRNSEMTLEVSGEVLGIGIRGNLEVRGRRAVQIARRLLDALKGE